MNLQNRIIIIVALSCFMMLGGLFIYLDSSQDRVNKLNEQIILDLQKKVLTKTVHDRLDQHVKFFDELETSDGVPLEKDQAAFEILNTELEVQFSSTDAVGPHLSPLLPDWVIKQVLQDGNPFHTIGRDRKGAVAAIGLYALEAINESEKELLNVIIPISNLELFLETEMEAQMILLDKQGNRVMGRGDIAAVLSEAIKTTPTDNFRSPVTGSHRHFDSSTFTLRDLGGGVLGYFSLLFDDTVEAKKGALVHNTALMGIIVFIGVLLLGLRSYIRQNFARLYNLINILDRLTKGEKVYYDIQARKDEIGDLSKAVDDFRKKNREIVHQQKRQERFGGRQQRFIRQQMEKLANRLGSPFSETLMEELSAIETGARKNKKKGELGMLAEGFEHMATRVANQYDEVNKLVAELREALMHKTKLVALEQELDIARQIQTSVLPSDLVVDGVVELHGTMKAAKEVGGDFYDFFEIDEDRIGVVVADVSGKGVPAAFFMLISRTLLKSTAMFGLSPSQVLHRLNDLLSAENEQMLFVTMMYGEINVKTGEFRYANAGHNPAYLLRKGESQPVEMPDGMALAVMEGMDFEEASLSLGPDDMLVLYTDGVTEAFNNKEELFGEDRLKKALDGFVDKNIADLPTGLRKCVDDFAGEVPQADDITIVGLRYLGQGQQGS
ncbi:SpoIIE family protein phosphatase [Terasakiella pusilla]|uniref:SpoIIE family protein phosphatase n=1 Tax=Terasakiella pusilla TaxID=64973 RepID=UPI003AA9A750